MGEHLYEPFRESLITLLLLRDRACAFNVRFRALQGRRFLNPERQARRTIRLPLRAPVTFWWTNGNGKPHRGEGRSRDVSDHGAFVFAPICPPVGAIVKLTMAVEGVPDAKGLCPLEVEGEILRVEQSPSGMEMDGFAIRY